MVAKAAARDITGIFTPPPSLDFALLSVSDDMKQLERSIDKLEGEAAAWRANSISKLSKLQLTPHGPDDESSHLEMLSEALKAVESGIEMFSKPMHGDPGVVQKIDELARLSVSAGRFVRKQMRRLEKTRIAQHAALVDIYYGILALQFEAEKKSDAIATFSDPAKLGNYLRSQLA